jgi:hypothetical protein
MSGMRVSRREFARLSAAAGAVVAGHSTLVGAAVRGAALPALREFGYGDVAVDSAPHQAQLRNTHEVLMNLSEDSLVKPFRQMVGQPAPGEDLGGWYNYDPSFNWRTDDAGFAPGATFGQWVSALARYHAITGSQPARAKVLRLNRLYAGTIGGGFYDQNRFPAYCYDKLLLGLIDSHQFAGDPAACHICRRPRLIASCRGGPARINRIAGTSRTRIPRTCFSPIAAAPGAATAIWPCGIWTMRPGSIPWRAARTCSPASMPTATSTR